MLELDKYRIKIMKEALGLIASERKQGDFWKCSTKESIYSNALWLVAAGLLRIESVRYNDLGSEDGEASFDVTREGRLRFFNRHRDNVWMVFDEYGFPRGAGATETSAWFSIMGSSHYLDDTRISGSPAEVEKIKNQHPGYTCKRVHMQPALSPDEVKEQGETVRAFFALY